MKTAVQQIINSARQGIEIHEKQINNPENSNIEKNRHSYLINICRHFESLGLLMLEKEKQQITDAFLNGQSTVVNTPEQYYNDTFS